jgi:hypothetical protein
LTSGVRSACWPSPASRRPARASSPPGVTEQLRAGPAPPDPRSPRRRRWSGTPSRSCPRGKGCVGPRSYPRPVVTVRGADVVVSKHSCALTPSTRPFLSLLVGSTAPCSWSWANGSQARQLLIVVGSDLVAVQHLCPEPGGGGRVPAVDDNVMQVSHFAIIHLSASWVRPGWYPLDTSVQPASGNACIVASTPRSTVHKHWRPARSTPLETRSA